MDNGKRRGERKREREQEGGGRRAGLISTPFAGGWGSLEPKGGRVR